MLQNGVGCRTSNSSGPAAVAGVGGSRGPASMAGPLAVGEGPGAAAVRGSFGTSPGRQKVVPGNRRESGPTAAPAADSRHHQLRQTPFGQPLRKPPQPPFGQPRLPKPPHGELVKPPRGALRNPPNGVFRKPPRGPLANPPRGPLRNAPLRNSHPPASPSSAEPSAVAASRSARSRTSSGGASAPSGWRSCAFAADTAALATTTVPAA